MFVDVLNILLVNNSTVIVSIQRGILLRIIIKNYIRKKYNNTLILQFVFENHYIKIL